MSTKQIPTLTGIIPADDSQSANTIAMRDPSGDVFGVTLRGHATGGVRSGGHFYQGVLASQAASFNLDESATYNATLYPVDATATSRTVTLPAAVSVAGKVVEIKKVDASANPVLVSGNGSELIDGVNKLALYMPNDCIRLVCNGTGWVVSGNRPDVLATAILASSPVSNTVAETAFDNVALTIKGNTLRVAETIRIRAQGIVTSHNASDTLNVKVKIGSTVLVATGAINNAVNDIFYVDLTFTFRAIGASGKFICAGVIANGVEGTVTAKPFKLAEVTSFDTTADQAITVTATWSAASASDSVRLDVFVVERVAA